MFDNFQNTICGILMFIDGMDLTLKGNSGRINNICNRRVTRAIDCSSRFKLESLLDSKENPNGLHHHH